MDKILVLYALIKYTSYVYYSINNILNVPFNYNFIVFTMTIQYLNFITAQDPL